MRLAEQFASQKYLLARPHSSRSTFPMGNFL